MCRAGKNVQFTDFNNRIIEIEIEWQLQESSASVSIMQNHIPVYKNMQKAHVLCSRRVKSYKQATVSGSKYTQGIASWPMRPLPLHCGVLRDGSSAPGTMANYHGLSAPAQQAHRTLLTGVATDTGTDGRTSALISTSSRPTAPRVLAAALHQIFCIFNTRRRRSPDDPDQLTSSRFLPVT